MITDLLLPSNLTVINATPFIWEKSLNESSQMVQWDDVFPDQVNPGDILPIPLEFTQIDSSATGNGVIIYTVNDDVTNNTFDFSLTASSDQPHAPLSIDFLPSNNGVGGGNGNDDDVPDSAPGHHIDLAWNPNSTAGAPFIFSLASISRKSASAPPPPPTLPMDWMQQNLATLGCHPLRHICLPGSHDAGMSKLNGGTFMSIPDNTLTQWTDIAGQLAAGIRYFDLRPVIAGGQFVMGHYSKIGSNWFGGNGQDLASIISQVNSFLSQNKELVILDLSHMFNTDDNWRTLHSDEFSRLLNQLQDLQYRYSGPTGPNGDLSTVPLKNFIANGPSVVVINSESSVSLPPNPPAGIYPFNAMNIYNNYANTPFAPIMRNDQLKKMSQQKPNRDAPMFLLSWTLTTPADIRGLAIQAADMLFESSDQGLWSTVYRGKGVGSHPNILMLDGIGKTGRDSLAGGKNVAGISMAINNVVLEGVACPA